MNVPRTGIFLAGLLTGAGGIGLTAPGDVLSGVHEQKTLSAAQATAAQAFVKSRGLWDGQQSCIERLVISVSLEQDANGDPVMDGARSCTATGGSIQVIGWDDLSTAEMATKAQAGAKVVPVKVVP